MNLNYYLTVGPFVSWIFGWLLVGRFFRPSVCHNFLKGRELTLVYLYLTIRYILNKYISIIPYLVFIFTFPGLIFERHSYIYR